MANTILITGASSGIGKAAAKYFLAKGWNVSATMRSPSSEKDLTDSENLIKMETDVTDKTSVVSAVETTVKHFGGIDVLLNNAGYGSAGPMEAATDQQIKRQFDVNLFGVIETIRAVLPHFRKKNDGMIINISSIGGLVTFPLFSLYHASKWAVEGLSESLQYELNPLGIKIKVVEPGGVKTDFAGRSMDFFDINGYEDYSDTVNKITHYFRADGERRAKYAEPDKIAEVIFKAATDGTDQFRYIAGNDAASIWETRKKLSFEEFRHMITESMLK